jgi:hypothetical protein
MFEWVIMVLKKEGVFAMMLADIPSIGMRVIMITLRVLIVQNILSA